MKLDYFHRVAAETPTRLWINNPTGDEIRDALQAGAIAGTTNPSYCAKLLDREPHYIGPILAAFAKESDEVDEIADKVYQSVSRRFMEAFLPLYARTMGREGYVTMQDNPNRDDDPRAILKATALQKMTGPNYMAKIPVTEAGMEAMVQLVREGTPVCATECFSVSQAIAMCELYETVSRKSNSSPPFFITHITGIFDEEITSYIEREHVSIGSDVAALAGTVVARKIHSLIKERGYRAKLLGGGARRTQHFSEFVGGEVHITLNWETIRELLNENPPVVRRIDADVDPEIIVELNRKLPYFAKAFNEDGLARGEYRDFAPLQRFRNSFLKGWGSLCRAIVETSDGSNRERRS